MRIVSGIQPSGKLHLGNYFGAIHQWLPLQHEAECFFFIADLHALTTVRDAGLLRTQIHDVALDYLALGLDPSKAVLFRQFDIPEVTELFWYLSSIAPMGLLERAVSFKDKLAHGISADLGLFSYPVLMAADIVVYGADAVPVGKDQVQHLEMTRDIASKFNQMFVPKYDPADPENIKGKAARGILKLPSAKIQESTAVVPGLDGQKMSKSYGNTIELFAEDNVIKKKIMGIKTDSSAVEEPKDPEAGPLVPLIRLFATPEQLESTLESYRKGGEGYGVYKKQLLDMFHATFDAARAKRKELANDRGEVERILARGAEKARATAAPIMDAVRRAVGMK